MHRASVIFGTALLLSIILAATVLASIVYMPRRSTPQPTTTALVSTSSAPSNETKLVVRARLPNGTNFSSGLLHAGDFSTNASSNQQYVFSKINPGTYPLSFTEAGTIYLPPTNVKVSAGLNHANITIYPLSIFVIYETDGLSLNGTQPGPTIQVMNGTAVQLVIRNNTTLIHSLAVVESVANESSANILFNSLSDTLNAGGTTNATFVVTMPGSFFYEDIIGNHARVGEYGVFDVLLPNQEVSETAT